MANVNGLEDPSLQPLYSDCCEDLFKACEEQCYDRVKSLLEENDGDQKNFLVCCKNEDKKTPLHIAATVGNVRIVVLLIKRKANVLEEDKWKRTPLMYACDEGHIEVVQLLLRKIPKRDQSLNIQDNKNSFTALHYAATNGCKEIVQILIDHEVDCKKQNKLKYIPMMCACINGHEEVVKILLKTGFECSPVTYQAEQEYDAKPHQTPAAAAGTISVVTQESQFNGSGTTETSTKVALLDSEKEGRVSILMTAINRKQEQIAMAIVKSRQVREALEYSYVDKGKKVDALRKLIEKMPIVAEQAFRFCIDIPARGDTIDNGKEIVKFNYEFIDDLAFECFNPQSKARRYVSSNHCLNILMNSKNSIELVKHPLITTLLYLKWTTFAQVLFGFNFFFHLLNVSFITVFATIVYQPGAETCIADNFNSTLTCDASRQYAAGTFAALVLIMSLIKLCFESFQMIVLRHKYFLDWINYVEVFMSVGSFTFAFIYLYDCYCPESWQWQLGAFCVFLAWIDFIHFLRMLPFFGIYVIMFGVIVQKFLYVVVLALLLIMSFAIPFYMLFHDPVKDKDLLTPFQDPGKSIMKTLTMTAGEFDYDTLFRQDYSSGPKLPYGISYFFWILFVSLMPILLANLLTGLAVDDVNEIRENAKIRTLCLWARHLQTVERLLPMFLYCRHRSQINKFLLKYDDDKKVKFRIDLNDFPKRPSFRCCNRLGEPYSKFKRWLWFNSLELNYFDTYDNTVLPAASMKTDELLKQISKLMSEVEAIKKNLLAIERK